MLSIEPQEGSTLEALGSKKLRHGKSCSGLPGAVASMLGDATIGLVLHLEAGALSKPASVISLDL